MKQETKKLITGLKNWYEKFRSEAPLTPYTEWAVGDGKGYADEGASNMDKVIALLDSLESLENPLKHGGFIPDRNGKPCKDGDRVKIFANNEETTGTVKWISDCGYFLICSDGDDSYNWYLDELRDCGHGWFEKED